MTISLTSTDPLGADRPVLLALLGGAGTGTIQPPPPVVIPPVDWFPATKTKAPYPSPEGTTLIRLGNVLPSPNYLRDADGKIIELVDVSAEFLTGCTINGSTTDAGGVPGGADNHTISQILLRNGKAYYQDNHGFWLVTRTANNFYQLGGNPPAVIVPGGPPPPPPVLPARPARSAIAPGSSGKVINCGAGQTIPALAAALAIAAAGDTIVVAPGEYHEAVPGWSVPLKIKMAGAHFDFSGLTDGLAWHKGGFVPNADTEIEGGKITGVAMDIGFGSTAGVRMAEGCPFLRLTGVTITGCQLGVGNVTPVVFEAVDCDISGNGLGPETLPGSHNMYFNPGAYVRLTRTKSTGPTNAHAVKMLGPELIVEGGTYGAANAAIFDMPLGGKAILTGVFWGKAAGDPNHNLFSAGEAGQDNGAPDIHIEGGSIAVLCDNPFIGISSGAISFHGVAFSGNKITSAGGAVVTGLPT